MRTLAPILENILLERYFAKQNIPTDTGPLYDVLARIGHSNTKTNPPSLQLKLADAITEPESVGIKFNNAANIASNVGRLGTHLTAGYAVGAPTYDFLEPHVGPVAASLGSYAATAPGAGAVEGIWSGASSLLARQGVKAAAGQAMTAAGAGVVADLLNVPGWMLALTVPLQLKANEMEAEALDKSIQKQVAAREFENNNRQRAGQDPLPKIDPAKEKDSYYWLKAITPKFMPGGMGP
jgi:hypothetical protein